MSDFWERKSPMQKTKFILGLILLVLITVFAIANWVTIPFSLIFVTVNIPLTVLILSAMLFGYIVASFTEGNYKRKREKETIEKRESDTLSEEE